MCFVGLDVCINLPEVGLFKGQGFFSAIGYVLTILLGVLLVIWVGYSIYAGYKIVTSSMAKGLEEGVTILKNWNIHGLGILCSNIINWWYVGNR